MYQNKLGLPVNIITRWRGRHQTEPHFKSMALVSLGLGRRASRHPEIVRQRVLAVETNAAVSIWACLGFRLLGEVVILLCKGL